MAKVSFKRYETDLEAQESDVIDGQLIVTKDGTLYTDYEDERIPLGGGSSSSHSIYEETLEVNFTVYLQKKENGVYINIKSPYTDKIALQFYKNGAMVVCETDIEVVRNSGNQTYIETDGAKTYIYLSNADSTEMGSNGKIRLTTNLETEGLNNYIAISLSNSNTRDIYYLSNQSSEFQYDLSIYKQSLRLEMLVTTNNPPSYGKGSVTYMAQNTRID